MPETYWTTRHPFDRSAKLADPDGEALHGIDRGVIVIAGFEGSDWIRVPPETPAPNGRGLHPYAGRQVRVTHRFRSVDPTGNAPGDHYVHLWAQDAGVGVAETPAGFAVYHLEPAEIGGMHGFRWPEGWPQHPV